jgi:hypothetical protein
VTARATERVRNAMPSVPLELKSSTEAEAPDVPPPEIPEAFSIMVFSLGGI